MAKLSSRTNVSLSAKDTEADNSKINGKIYADIFILSNNYVYTPAKVKSPSHRTFPANQRLGELSKMFTSCIF